MKKSFVLMMLAVACATFTKAQKFGYAKGDNLLNVGIGVNSYYDKGIPIGASYELGITDEISAGLNFDYLGSTYNYGYGSYKFSVIYFGVRGAYHFNDLLDIENSKVDLYGGATIGYRSFSFKDTYSGTTTGGSYASDVYLGAFIGGKYYFSKNTGAFVELGAIGSTNARVGLAFKF